MPDKPPSFQWYPKDCDTDENVRMMSDAEYGFYGRCLNHSWVNDGLPGTLEDIALALGRTTRQVERYWPRVGKCFELIEKRFRNFRQERQRLTAREFQDSRRKAANLRWEREREQCTSNAHALHVECSASASASAIKEVLPTEVPRKPPSNGSRLSIESAPPEWIEWCKSDCGWSETRARLVFENFRDYWISKAGAGARKTNWLATWRIWCRNEDKKSTQSTPQLPFSSRQDPTERAIAVARKRIEENGKL